MIAYAAMIVVIAALVGVMGWGLILLYRNEKVYSYRMELIDRCADADFRDIRNGMFDVDWRLREFRAVSYNEMVFKFWRPLGSFYARPPYRELEESSE